MLSCLKWSAWCHTSPQCAVPNRNIFIIYKEWCIADSSHCTKGSQNMVARLLCCLFGVGVRTVVAADTGKSSIFVFWALPVFARQTMNIQLCAKHVVFLDFPTLQPRFITLMSKFHWTRLHHQVLRSVFDSNTFQKPPRSSSPVCSMDNKSSCLTFKTGNRGNGIGHYPDSFQKQKSDLGKVLSLSKSAKSGGQAGHSETLPWVWGPAEDGT